MNRKWYLQTGFICLLFTLWPLIFPVIVGIILLFIQIVQDKKQTQKYSAIDDLEIKIEQLESDFQNKKNEYTEKEDFLLRGFEKREKILIHEFEEKEKALEQKLIEKEQKIDKEKRAIIQELNLLKEEEKSLSEGLILEHFKLSEYDGLSSEECKNKLVLLRNEEQDLIKSDDYIYIATSESKQRINNNKKQIIRCFNSECDNVLMNISVKNIDAMRSKISKHFESLNKIFMVDGIQLSKKALEYKLEELNLVYTYELKREQEREQQKAIKEQMIEEEKVRREIEKQKAKLEKDQQQCSNEVAKLMAYLQKSQNDIERQLYVDKIRELEEKLKELESEKETVLEREANAKAGFVYIISNIGSFGDGVYKIGMTRRLEPMDRIKELSSASVPFEFDVHAMIFSNDAPELENMLHKYFEKHSVNRVNMRKEFFRVSLDEIEKVVKENFNNTVEFTRIPVAKEWHQTLSILEAEASA